MREFDIRRERLPFPFVGKALFDRDDQFRGFIYDNGNTFESVWLWRAVKGLFGLVGEAWLNFTPPGFVPILPQFFDGKEFPRAPDEGGLVLVGSDSQVVDGDGNPVPGRYSGPLLYLGGCTSGYGGTGPNGTAEVLRSAGFESWMVDLVFDYRTLWLIRDPPEVRVAENRGD